MGCKIETGGEGAAISALTAMGCKESVVVFGAVTGIWSSVSDQSVIGIRTLRHWRINAIALRTSRSAPAHEQGIKLFNAHLPPGRPAVVALVRAFGGFHLAQKGVHFFNGEFAVGAHCAVAGHG